MSRPPLVIFGMHRSGTSLLARALDHLGLFVGYRLDSNHESIFFRRLNNWVLRQAGATWQSPEGLRLLDEGVAGEIEWALRGNLAGLRRFEYLGPLGALRYRDVAALGRPWGWKDPRNTFTGPLWRRIFPRARWIHIHRHPIDVAASLERRRRERASQYRGVRSRERDEDPPAGESGAHRARRLERGLVLWQAYVEEGLAFEASLGDRCVRIGFEELVENPVDRLDHLARFGGLDPSSSELRTIAAGVDPARSRAFAGSETLRRLDAERRGSPQAAALGYDPVE